MPQLAGAYEYERREAQGTANRQRSFVTVDRAHQRAHPLRIGYGGKVRRSYSRQGAAQIAGGIAFGAAGGDGITEHLAAIAEGAMRSLQRAALFDAPHRYQQFRRCQIRNRTTSDPGKYVAFEPGQYSFAVTPDPGFHLVVDPLAGNHFETVRRALH